MFCEMGNSVLVQILVFSLCAGICMGRLFLAPAPAPVLVTRPQQSSLRSSPSSLASGEESMTRPKNFMESSPPPEMAKGSHSNIKGLCHDFFKAHSLTIIIVSVIVACIMISSLCTWLYKKARRSASHKGKLDSEITEGYKGIPLGPLLNHFNSLYASKRKGCATLIEYSVLQSATNNFSSDNIIGQGGFGCVYKGRFDDDVFSAVKKLDEGCKQAEHEFQNEVDLMSRIRHPNLVSLLGFCTHGKTRLLVYELMQNGSLEDQLHGPSRGSALTWYLRMKIALDSARGLEHLHEQCHPSVIHRDFKSSNILLDASFNAKLSDFGLAITVARCSGNDVELLGTLGYVAPEYLLEGKLTEKSDVYAFGIVLLELITGRKPLDKSQPTECQSLVSWAMPLLRNREKIPSIVDPMIKDSVNLKHLYQVAAIAMLCVQPEPSYRPLIADVVHSLIPLVPLELGGTLRVADAPSSTKNSKNPL